MLAGIAVLAAAISVGIACNEGEQAPANTASGVEGTLSLGDSTELAAATIAESGGTITVGDEGGALEGLALEVAEGSYDAPRDFAVSYRSITGHSYDDRINPISPLISVDNGGDYADQVMALKVPVEVPEGHFAMGFFYDEETGALEGMPLLAVDDGFVTVGTRHFSDLFISSVLESVLLNITVDSGFRPAVDDWQFANYGSYIEDGHCAGQSIAAMWYYYERKLQGEPELYGRYDNYLSDEEQTPDLWEDDNLAYRLASTVQRDIDWKTLGFQLFLAIEGTDDTLQMLAFAYALHTTHAPQFVGLTDTVNGGGHAIVGYKIDGGNLYVADPNFPGVKSAEGKIEYVDGAFKPYRSALSAISDPTSFDKIGYYAVSALVDWEAVGARFAEMESGAVGDEYFPAYPLEGFSEVELAEVPLLDGVTFPDSKLAFVLPNFSWDIRVFRAGRALPMRGGFVDLQPGENKLGILASLNGRYVDFLRVSVVYNQVEISPNPVIGNAGEDLRMTATMPASVPNARYVWDYGDGTPNEDLSLSSMHVWAETGEYPVTLTVYDENDRLAGIGQATAQIGASTATPSGAGPGTGSASSGGWVLKGSETYKEVPDYEGDCYHSQEVTIAGLSATTSRRCSGTDYDVYQQTEHSWSAAPPERLAPGETLTITSTVTSQGTFGSIALSGGGSSWVRIYLEPGGGPYPGGVWASVEENDSTSAVSEFTIPSGSEGGLMWVTLALSSWAGSGGTTYTYEWQGP